MGRSSVVTLLTDFGDADAYVGAVRGVIRSVAPDAEIIDLAHGLPRGDVAAAAFTWSSVVAYFPPGTIHVAIVDPGVGTARRALAVAGGGYTYVAPDNGLLTGIVPARPGNAWQAVEIREPGDRRAAVSPTFHGRDLFAPAAGRLAKGQPLSALGPAVDPRSIRRIAGYTARRSGERVAGRVIAIDHFGNLRTNIPESLLPDAPVVSVRAGGTDFEISGLVRTFGDAAPGEAVAYVGSAGTLEVAIRDGSAAERLGVAAGARVTVTAGR